MNHFTEHLFMFLWSLDDLDGQRLANRKRKTHGLVCLQLPSSCAHPASSCHPKRTKALCIGPVLLVRLCRHHYGYYDDDQITGVCWMRRRGLKVFLVGCSWCVCVCGEGGVLSQRRATHHPRKWDKGTDGASKPGCRAAEDQSVKQPPVCACFSIRCIFRELDDATVIWARVGGGEHRGFIATHRCARRTRPAGIDLISRDAPLARWTMVDNRYATALVIACVLSALATVYVSVAVGTQHWYQYSSPSVRGEANVSELRSLYEEFKEGEFDEKTYSDTLFRLNGTVGLWWRCVLVPANALWHKEPGTWLTCHDTRHFPGEVRWGALACKAHLVR